jgi:hypothetical protein
VAGYLTKDQFKALTTMPSAYVDEIETRAPGFIDARLDLQSGLISSRLSKRYDAFGVGDNAPVVVKLWLTAMVTLDCWQKRGVSPTDEQYLEYKEAAVKADADIKEAADSVTGLFNLPLLPGSAASGIARGGPLTYSEQSPYVWADQQRDIGRSEDDSRGGTVT